MGKFSSQDDVQSNTWMARSDSLPAPNLFCAKSGSPLLLLHLRLGGGLGNFVLTS